MSTEIEIRAEITGTLWKILVATNTPQSAGSPLAVIESMKMEIPVEAPATGFVAEFLFEEGSAIEEGAVIARYVAD